MDQQKHFVDDPSPWIPITDVKSLQILVKFAEELFECAEALEISRLRDSAASLTWLTKEIADVLVNAELVAEHFTLDISPGVERVGRTGLSQLAQAIGRCGAAVSRCIIQGVDGAEPSTGEINREWLVRDMIAVCAHACRVVHFFQLDEVAIKERKAFKADHLRRWHQMEAAA